ncbi:MAG TPA: biotin/lipoyl-binding protein, partial [Candidatus Limnocylindrales bacterium]|nr:biotin/lipoyl-binding protein [Candidatus Limnocylindrales bacterium]
ISQYPLMRAAYVRVMTLIDDLDAPPRRRWLRWLALLVVLVIVVAAGLWVAHPFGTQAAAPITAVASNGTVVSSVDVSGAIEAGTVEELSFGASGTVKTLSAAVGQTVTAGQVLATIDDAAAQAQLNVAETNLTAAQARLKEDQDAPESATVAAARDSLTQAKQQVTDARQDLSDTEASNTQSLDAARSAVTSAEAKLAADKAATPPASAAQLSTDASAVTQAKQSLAAAQVRATSALHQARQQVSSATLGVADATDQYTQKTAPTTAAQLAQDEASVAQAQQSLITAQQTAGGSEIVSPIAGTVTAVQIAVGDKVSGSSGNGSTGSSSGSTSATGQIEVMDLAHLVLGGEVSDLDVAKLEAGQGATITADALGDTTLTGKICELDSVGTQVQGVTSYAAKICLDGTSPSLRVGMSADASVVVERADGVLVPSLAVQTVGGRQVVEVMAADGTVVQTAVTTGLSDGQETQIVSGLASGAKVVVRLQTSTTNGGTNGRGGGGLPGGGLQRVIGGGFGG